MYEYLLAQPTQVVSAEAFSINWNAVQGVGEIAAAFAAVAAIWFSLRLHREQIDTSRKLHHEQILLNQRQLLLPLWDHLSNINDIDTDAEKTIWVDVVKAVNTLELVALCWEAQAIDQNIIRRTFGDKFVQFYEKIQDCKKPPPGWKTGRQYLQENRAASKLYEEIKREINNQNALQPIGKVSTDGK